ncbi:MAG: HAMP domain-containing sensor histidine kinase [Candidatus Sericytochromatia bacterium]|nr:HAMP domain-containing sensor histidine kinase [Candidatus Sericytochromatia bacterium]
MTYGLTYLQLGELANLVGMVVPLALSLVLAAIYRRAFFTAWTALNATCTLLVLALAEASRLGHPTWLSALIVVVYLVAAWLMFETAAAVAPRDTPLRRCQLACALACLAGLGLLGVTGQLELALLPGVAIMTWAHLGLARRMVRFGRSGARGLGWLIGGSGLWALGFPLVAATSFGWLAHAFSGALHAAVGLWMAVFLLQEVAHELRAKNDELARLDEMKSNFLSTVSHELRTPLTVIKTGTWLLASEQALATPAARMLIKEVDQATEQLGTLLQDILDASRLASGAMQFQWGTGDLAEDLVQAAGLLGPVLRARQVDLQLAFGGPVSLIADHAKLRQVFSNLLLNAAKFSNPGGRVVVRLAVASAKVRVEVEDRGPGIPTHLHERIFEPFFQVDATTTRIHGGAGLGLSICRAIVAGHGGRIGVDSDPARRPGSTFWMELPLTPPVDPAPGAREATLVGA